MREIIHSTRFKKDLKRMMKRNAKINKLAQVIDLLADDSPLPEKCRPHKLSGEYEALWECHIEPDWLLVYDLDDPETLALVATGTHSDLFR